MCVKTFSQNVLFEEALVKFNSTLLNAKGRSAFALTRNKSRLANVQTLAERQTPSGCNAGLTYNTYNATSCIIEVRGCPLDDFI